MKDSRSISDKDFQRNAVRNIIQYLAEVGYSKPITPKTVSAPSTKDFLSIVEFLFQRFEGLQTFKIGAKPEEFTNDVMYIFSQIQYVTCTAPSLLILKRYPFPLMKSNISTVGAPHAWPAFLAALDWFVTLLKVCAQRKRGYSAVFRQKILPITMSLQTSRSMSTCASPTLGFCLEEMISKYLKRKLLTNLVCAGFGKHAQLTIS